MLLEGISAHDDFAFTSAAVPADALGLGPLIDLAELTSYLGVPVAAVYDWRGRGKGPADYRFGKHLKFAVSDVRAWVAEQREPSSQPDRIDRR